MAEIMEYLKEAVSQFEEDLWDYLEAEQYGSITHSAFGDEGVEVQCDLCDFTVGEADSNLTEGDALEILKDHLTEEHEWEIITKELKKALKNPKGSEE